MSSRSTCTTWPRRIVDDAVVMPVVDVLAACLPERDGRPYLAVFVLDAR